MVWLLNILLPGTGLIVRGREWVGFLICLIFGLFGQVVLAGFLVAPEALPGWLTGLAVGLAVLTWVCAQVLLVSASHRGEGLARELPKAGALDKIDHR